MIARIFVTTAALLTFSAVAPAEDPAGWIEELRALRQVVEQQSRQLDALTRQVAKLAAAAEGKPAPQAEPEPAPAAPAAGEFSINAPKAEPAGPPRHIIVKGETLTSIAKHYNIPVADLQKANKDVVPGKLQIGQAIVIPAVPNAKNPEPTPEKKETP